MAWRNIVVTQHCKVSMKMNLLVVQTDDDTVQIPIDDIGMVLFATTQAVITTSAMASLLERDIKVVFCNDKHLPIGETNPYKTESSRRVCIVQQMGWAEERKEHIMATNRARKDSSSDFRIKGKVRFP